MAFKGTPQPDMISLALNLMQMKRDKEFNERELALREFEAQQSAQANAIKAQREAIDFELSLKERQAALKEQGVKHEDAMTDRESNLGALIETANSPERSEADRYSSARAFDMAVQNQAALGRDPTLVGANAGAGLALKGQAQDEAMSKARSGLELEDEFIRRREAREEARMKRVEAARMRLEADLAKTEGVFNGEALRSTRTWFNEESKPAIANEKAWGFYNRFNPKNKQQIIDAVQLAQRAIDPVNVTEGDMRLRVAAGLDSQEALIRRFEEWKTGSIAIPVELGQVIKDNLREKLEIADDMSSLMFDQQEDYANRNGLDDAQRNFVLTNRELAERVRSRVGKRGTSDAAPVSRSRRGPAQRSTGRPPRPAVGDTLSPEQVADEGLPQ